MVFHEPPVSGTGGYHFTYQESEEGEARADESRADRQRRQAVKAGEIDRHTQREGERLRGKAIVTA